MRFGEFELHDYQNEAVEAVEREFASGRRSTLLVLATGLGKTVVKGAVAARRIAAGGRVLVLAHRKELIDQAAKKMRLMGLDPKIERAEQRVASRHSQWSPSLVVGSVQTLQGKRLASWDPKSFDLIAIDEAHHAPGNSYKAIFRHFADAHRLGVTATPDRADEVALADIFETIAYQKDLEAGIKEGRLARLRVVQCETGVDLSKLHRAGDDLDEGEVDEAVRAHIATLVNATRQEIGTRKAVVFVPRVATAELFASALQSIGVTAEAISGKSDYYSRHAILRKFTEGRFQVLVNCALLIEGWDEPTLEAVVLARPTMSRSLMAQMVGRGTRLCPGKTEVLIVDFAWLTGRHKLAIPLDLFPSDPDEEVRSRARVLIASGEVTDPVEALEVARRRIEAERLAAVERAAAAKRKAEQAAADKKARRDLQIAKKQARYERREADPFDGDDPQRKPLRHAGLSPEESLFALPELSEPADAAPATAGQIRALEKFRVEVAPNLTRRRASRLLDVLQGRFRRGLATVGQVRALLRDGANREFALTVTREVASQWLDVIVAGRRKGAVG